MCSEPFTLSGWSLHRERRFTNVQWTLQPSSERRFTQCAVGPSSLLRSEVYPVCIGPIIPNWPCKMRFTQCAASFLSILRMRFGQCAVGPSSITRLKDEVHPVCGEPFTLPGWNLHMCSWAPHPQEMKSSDFTYINILMPIISHILCISTLHSSITCINSLESRAWHVSCINPLWTRLPYFLNVNLLMPRVSHVLFIKPLWTKVSHVLTLCGLEYHVSNVLALCGLHYHI